MSSLLFTTLALAAIEEEKKQKSGGYIQKQKQNELFVKYAQEIEIIRKTIPQFVGTVKIWQLELLAQVCKSIEKKGKYVFTISGISKNKSKKYTYLKKIAIKYFFGLREKKYFMLIPFHKIIITHPLI